MRKKISFSFFWIEFYAKSVQCLKVKKSVYRKRLFNIFFYFSPWGGYIYKTIDKCVYFQTVCVCVFGDFQDFGMFFTLSFFLSIIIHIQHLTTVSEDKTITFFPHGYFTKTLFYCSFWTIMFYCFRSSPVMRDPVLVITILISLLFSIFS